MPLPPTTTKDESCLPCPVTACDSVFDRVVVSYHIRGGTRVAWELLNTFRDPLPHVFTLQIGTQGLGRGDVEEFEDVGLPVTDGFYAIDPLQRAWGKDNLAVYRVKLETTAGVYYSLPTGGMGILDTFDWGMAREIVWKELIQHRRAGTDGYLLKRRWGGVECPRCLDFQTREVKDPDCPVCYGTGWQCGYYRPMGCAWAMLNPRTYRVQLDGAARGNVSDIVVQARMLALPLLGEEDVWINRKTDDRYYVHTVQNLAEVRGVPVVVQAELRPAPFTSVAYTIPIPGDVEALEMPR